MLHKSANKFYEKKKMISIYERNWKKEFEEEKGHLEKFPDYNDLIRREEDGTITLKFYALNKDEEDNLA